jgi:hypothetical protein
MNRFKLLIRELRNRFPNDEWLKNYDETIKYKDETFHEKYDIYSDALECLNQASWEVLLNKAPALLKQTDLERGKIAFFNELNETLAYQYLIECGFENVQLLEAKDQKNKKNCDLEFHKNKKNCDLEFHKAGSQYFCEVKTINVSIEELERSSKGEVFDGSVYAQLNDNFFKKMSDCIDVAKVQLKSRSDSSENVIYLVVHFDDWTGFYHERYKQQLDDFFENKGINCQVYLRIGLYKPFECKYLPIT